MTQATITRRIRKYLKAQAEGRLTAQEVEGFMEALASEMKAEDAASGRLPRSLTLHAANL
jgi:hypothetical protein